MTSESNFTQLGEVVENHDSRRIPLSSMQRLERSGPYPYYGATEIMDFVDDFIFEGLHILLAEDGSVLNEDGSPVLQLVDGKFWVNNHAHVLRGSDDIDTRFLYYALSISYAAPWVTGAVQLKINQKSMNKIEINYPPRGEREIIVSRLKLIDDYIENEKQKSSNIQKLISALFRSWFIDFDPVKAKKEGKLPYGMDEETAALFPDSFEDSEFGLIPTGWKLQTLSDIAQIIDCSHATKPEPIDTGYGVLLHVWNIDDAGGITLHETFEVEENEFHSWASRMVLSEGDCVVTKTGRVAAVGRIPHNLGRNLAMGRNMIGIRMENTPGFLYAYLMSPLKEIEVIKWLNSGTVMPSLHVKYAERLSVIVPSKDILAKFQEIVEPLIRLIDDSRANCFSLSSCRDVLLPRLMSGELKVPMES